MRNWYGTTDAQLRARLVREAAAQGHPDAQGMPRQMYEDGRGVEQSYAMAAKWFRKAAEHVPTWGEQGQGRNELGLLYVDGLGVPKDYVQAYMWFTLANAEENCKYVQGKMTPAQILKRSEWLKSGNDFTPHPEIFHFLT